MQTWTIGLAANSIISVTFVAVAVMLAVNLTKTREWRANPLAVGTFFIFLSCGGGHVVHTFQLLEVSLGSMTVAGVAARVEYTEWHVWVVDGITAAAGVWYWTMRRKFPDLVSGAAMFEDLRERRRRALEIHDNVVQGLVRAKLALDTGRDAEGHETVGDTLEAAKHIITGLLGEETIHAGELRRTEAAR